MSGGKGGSTTSSVQIPSWLEDAAKTNLSKADYAGQIGYTPYYGPDVAAQNQNQMIANQATYDAAAAFGLAPQGGSANTGMPTPTTYANGVTGYSSGDLYDQAVAELAARSPGQAEALNSMFIDPYAGGIQTIFTPEGSVGTNDAASVNISNYMGSDGSSNGVAPPKSDWEALMAANNFNQTVKDYPMLAPGGFLTKGISFLNDAFVIDPYQAQHGVTLNQYANGGTSSTGDSGYVSGNYGGNTISYGTATDSGQNSAAHTAGGTGRTDGGFGW